MVHTHMQTKHSHASNKIHKSIFKDCLKSQNVEEGDKNQRESCVDERWQGVEEMRESGLKIGWIERGEDT